MSKVYLIAPTQTFEYKFVSNFTHINGYVSFNYLDNDNWRRYIKSDLHFIVDIGE